MCHVRLSSESYIDESGGDVYFRTGLSPTKVCTYCFSEKVKTIIEECPHLLSSPHTCLSPLAPIHSFLYVQISKTKF